MTSPNTSDLFGGEDYGYPQQSTRCKALVYSHVVDNPDRGRIDCSLDIISCELSKTIKGGGQASFALVPRKNYLNLIFPDDYVNIYFDPGDGRGYIRTFFGFVDRINRTINTDAGTGATTTRFQVQCSDFTKAFDKTNIYFNPHVATRKDLINEWRGGNIGGTTLRTKGIAMYGSPADIVMSLSHLLFGFSSQYILPESYPTPNLTETRAARNKWARERLSSDVLQAIGTADITQFEKDVKDLAEQIKQERLAQRETNVKIDGVSISIPYDLSSEEEVLILNDAEELKGIPIGATRTQEWRTALTIEQSTKRKDKSLLDLIDFRFVDWKAIDGFIAAASICRSEGSLWSLMNSWSNEILNELFCDLRPMPPDMSEVAKSIPGTDLQTQQDAELKNGYGNDKDELGENTGVRFAPCMVMREYPFGTIEGIVPPADLMVLGKTLGNIYIGALFSKEPGIPGRKLITIPAMHPVLITKSSTTGKTEYATKSLDVAVISVKDIIQENVGRGDVDHVNLLEVYSDVSSGNIYNSKFLTQEVQPIVSTINVLRHGLRVRTYQTKFARFSSGQKFEKSQEEISSEKAQADSIVDEMKFHWPRPTPQGTGIVGRFRPPAHQGLDLTGSVGDIVLAAGDGLVFKATPWTGKSGGPGILNIYHGVDKSGGNWVTSYVHMDPASFEEFGITQNGKLKKGLRVTAGQQIARMGQIIVPPGKYPHLHFETRVNGKRVDPELHWGESTKKTTPQPEQKESETTELVKKMGVDSVHNRRLLIRWAMMLDHFYQHNLEYLTGTISTRAFPEIRVGYRLDIKERNESYYIEGVNHSWSYPNALLTTFTVSRGQRNNPFPVYIAPGSECFNGLRGEGSRLGDFFHATDTSATIRASIGFRSQVSEIDAIDEGTEDQNLTDVPTMQPWALRGALKGQSKPGYLIADSEEISTSEGLATAEDIIQYDEDRKAKEDLIGDIGDIGGGIK